MSTFTPLKKTSKVIDVLKNLPRPRFSPGAPTVTWWERFWERLCTCAKHIQDMWSGFIRKCPKQRQIWHTHKDIDIFMRLMVALCWSSWVWLFHQWLPLQPVASWACPLSTSCGQGSLCQAASFRRHYSTTIRQPSAQFGVYVKKVMFLDFF